jgi:hypothetical protein
MMTIRESPSKIKFEMLREIAKKTARDMAKASPEVGSHGYRYHKHIQTWPKSPQNEGSLLGSLTSLIRTTIMRVMEKIKMLIL